MSPMVSVVNEKKSEFYKIDKELIDEKKKLLSMRKYIEKFFENVGNNFSQKVRRFTMTKE